MVVLATSLGLRFDELGDVNIQDFRPDLSLTRTNYIQFLTLGIQGKTDQQKVYYKVYFQDQVPQLCPCRLLLVWMSFMNFKDGSYLFPTKIALNKFLINRSTRSQAFFSSPIKYYSLRHEIEDFFVDGLGILLRVFGTHIFRKTFYLFGQLGGATYEKLKFAARHKHDSSAMLVRSTFVTLYNICSFPYYHSKNTSPFVIHFYELKVFKRCSYYDGNNGKSDILGVAKA